MTQEEKAKAYDEAIETCKRVFNFDNLSYTHCEIKERLEQIFPELSEDERIRKALVKTFEKKLERGFEWIEFGIPNRAVLDWLEKQKKQNSSEPIQDSVKFDEGFKTGREVGFREGVESVKPAEVDEYEIVKKHITRDFLSGEVNKRLKECGWYVTDEKPAEWSDNFEENIRALLHDKLTWHSEDGSVATTVLIDDKTLKDIISGIWFYVKQEQPESGNSEKPNDHAECSEDEKIRKELITFICQFAPEHLKVKYVAYLEKQKEKSEKPIIPEEEEKVMKAIDGAIRVYGKTQGEWIAGYDMDTLVVHLRKAFAALEKQKEPYYSPLCNTIKDKIREYIANHFIADTVVKTDMRSIVKAMEEGVRLGKEEQKLNLTDNGKGFYKICPHCKSRMIRDDSKVYTSMPPQYGYNCPKCGAMEFDTVMYDNPEMEDQKPDVDKYMEGYTKGFKDAEALYNNGVAFHIDNPCICKLEPDVVIESKTNGTGSNVAIEQKPSISCGHENDIEWSEEDEKMLVGIIERGSAQIPPFETALRGEQMEWLMNRLKSLRPRPHWKPTEEQMKKLNIAIACYEGDWGEDNAKPLRELYEELKKL